MLTRQLCTYSNTLMRLTLCVVLSGLLLGSSCQRKQTETYDQARKRMVENQIIGRGIEDKRVIAAMLKVPRHAFIPEKYRHYAYSDSPVPIGDGQTISQPYIVALMSEELDLRQTDRVLEIGTGSGYQAAILGEIVEEVYTIEIVERLGRRAQRTLRTLKYDNIKVMIGDGYKGWPEYAPFDRIIVTCAPTDIPPPLVEQLTEGGIMVIPVGRAGFQYLYRVRKYMGTVEREKIIPVSFVPLTGPYAK